jgi:predicted nucleotidyltransferase
MPWRFQEALDMALEELQHTAGVEGILFFGSAQTGTAGPTSDLDLYVVTDGGPDCPQISLRRYAGVDAEVHLAPRTFWQHRLEANSVVIIHAFATGEALLDKNGAIADLAQVARQKVEAGPPALSKHDVDRWRYRLTDMAKDLEDVAGQPADERLLAAMLVNQALQGYCELNRLWGDKPKRLLAYVERHDPELGRLARSFFTGNLDRHMAQRVVDRVLAPHGGPIYEWASEPGAPVGHA